VVPCADLLAQAVREMWVGGTVADGLSRLVDLSWSAGQILQRSAPGQGELLDRSHKSVKCATDLETSCLAVPIVITSTPSMRTTYVTKPQRFSLRIQVISAAARPEVPATELVRDNILSVSAVGHVADAQPPRPPRSNENSGASRPPSGDCTGFGTHC
jgi:hypothetical protein